MATDGSTMSSTFEEAQAQVTGAAPQEVIAKGINSPFSTGVSQRNQTPLPDSSTPGVNVIGGSSSIASGLLSVSREEVTAEGGVPGTPLTLNVPSDSQNNDIVAGVPVA